MSSSKTTHLVIIPTYNEKENIYDFINELCNFDISILIVDDNSPDGTGEIVKKLSSVSDQVNLLSRKSKQGLGSAYRDGFKWGIENQYKYFIQMDADYSHRFEDLVHLLAESLLQDVVIGSRYISGGGSVGWDMKRKLLSIAANKISRIILKSNINDMTSGFRIYSTKALEKVSFSNTESNGYSFQIEMTYLFISKGLKIKEFPITFYERSLGKSKMSKSIAFEAIYYLVKTKFIK